MERKYQFTFNSTVPVSTITPSFTKTSTLQSNAATIGRVGERERKRFLRGKRGKY